MESKSSFLLITDKSGSKIINLLDGSLHILHNNEELTTFLNNIGLHKTTEILSTENNSIHLISSGNSQRTANTEVVELLSEITHEVNNSLAIVLTSVKVINKILSKEKIEKKELIESNFSDIEASISRVKNFLVEQRSQARSLPVNSTSLRITDLINDLKRAFSLVFSEDEITLNFDLDDNLNKYSISSLGTTLYQCLFNLINNSYYALKKDQQIKEKEINVRFFKENDTLNVSIIDNGPGIPSDLRDKIFKKNYTTKGSEGSGIGLFLVEKYIGLNSGSIKLDHDYNRGAKFDITIPVQKERTTILCVDDDPKVLGLLEELMSEDFEVIISTDAKTALSILKQHKIDIIISDFNMPNITGVELYTLMQKEKQNIPFILFSAYVTEKDQTEFSSFKDFTYVQKGSISNLLTAIDQISNKHMA